MSNKFTEDMLTKVLPKNQKSNVNPKLVKDLNKILKDQDMKENFRDNMLGHADVMAGGRYKMGDYINAVKYISFKLLGYSNILAYTKTFPDRYQAMVTKNYEERHIAGVVSAYNGRGLVNKIYEQTIVPTHILNADLFQKALNVQAGLMLTAKSDFVKSNAANSILNILKPPEAVKMELDVNVQENDSIRQMRQTTLELVAQQRLVIQAGVSTVEEIAHSQILIEGEVVDG